MIVCTHTVNVKMRIKVYAKSENVFSAHAVCSGKVCCDVGA